MVVVEVVGKGVDGNLKKQDNMQKRLQEAASKASKRHKHTRITLFHIHATFGRPDKAAPSYLQCRPSSRSGCPRSRGGSRRSHPWMVEAPQPGLRQLTPQARSESYIQQHQCKSLSCFSLFPVSFLLFPQPPPNSVLPQPPPCAPASPPVLFLVSSSSDLPASLLRVLPASEPSCCNRRPTHSAGIRQNEGARSQPLAFWNKGVFRHLSAWN